MKVVKWFLFFFTLCQLVSAQDVEFVLSDLKLLDQNHLRTLKIVDSLKTVYQKYNLKYLLSDSSEFSFSKKGVIQSATLNFSYKTENDDVFFSKVKVTYNKEQKPLSISYYSKLGLKQSKEELNINIQISYVTNIIKELNYSKYVDNSKPVETSKIKTIKEDGKNTVLIFERERFNQDNNFKSFAKELEKIEFTGFNKIKQRVLYSNQNLPDSIKKSTQPLIKDSFCLSGFTDFFNVAQKLEYSKTAKIILYQSFSKNVLIDATKYNYNPDDSLISIVCESTDKHYLIFKRQYVYSSYGKLELVTDNGIDKNNRSLRLDTVYYSKFDKHGNLFKSVNLIFNDEREKAIRRSMVHFSKETYFLGREIYRKQNYQIDIFSRDVENKLASKVYCLNGNCQLFEYSKIGDILKVYEYSKIKMLPSNELSIIDNLSFDSVLLNKKNYLLKFEITADTNLNISEIKQYVSNENITKLNMIYKYDVVKIYQTSPIQEFSKFNRPANYYNTFITSTKPIFSFYIKSLNDTIFDFKTLKKEKNVHSYFLNAESSSPSKVDIHYDDNHNVFDSVFVTYNKTTNAIEKYFSSSNSKKDTIQTKRRISLIKLNNNLYRLDSTIIVRTGNANLKEEVFASYNVSVKNVADSFSFPEILNASLNRHSILRNSFTYHPNSIILNILETNETTIVVSDGNKVISVVKQIYQYDRNGFLISKKTYENGKELKSKSLKGLTIYNK